MTAKSLLPWQVTYSQVSGIGTWRGGQGEASLYLPQPLIMGHLLTQIPLLPRGRSARSPVRQGPMEPTARLSAAATTGPSAPQSMAPAPARRVTCLLPHPTPQMCTRRLPRWAASCPPTHMRSQGACMSGSSQGDSRPGHQQLKGIRYQGVRGAEGICKGM